jgi:outer membrane receptor for ferrienterochelin and colicins
MALLLGGRLSAQDPAAAAGTGAPPESVLFEALPVVEAATLHTQTLQEAPASITVISSNDIRTYGFRTLGEALASVRGFYITYDRDYHYAGLRGFSLPGDYNTRFLVMLNGHYLTENIYSSNNFFGQDFGLDMDLVERIEIVRGPSSALYGSNGIFATINVVTKSPVDARRLRATTETGSFGEKKIELSSGMNLGHGANLLVSASVFNNSGQSLYFPEFNSPQTNYGWSRGADGERGYHLFANLIWHNWSFTGYLGSRQKQLPTGWSDLIFADPGNSVRDARGFFEAAYSRDLSASRKVRWRIYYDQYRFRARYDAVLSDQLSSARDEGTGDWVGSQLAYDFAIPKVGVLTVGGEVNADIRALEQAYFVSPEPVGILDVDHPNVAYGFFAQQQWRLSPAWNAYLGVRFDDSKNHPHFVSPRVALVYQASEKSSYKFLFGRAFRNPSAYETYYSNGIYQTGNAVLGPERADTFEVAAEHRFSPRLSGLVSAYHYQISGLIADVVTADGMAQYQNIEQASSNGVETELSGKLKEHVEVTASVAVQRTTEAHGQTLTNSPECVGKLRGSIPLARNKMHAAMAIQYLSTREVIGSGLVPSYWLADVTLTTMRVRPDFDVQFGVRNLFNQSYYDPVSAGLFQDVIRQDGRSMFVKLIWRAKE